MPDDPLIPIAEETATHALIDAARYEEMYKASVADPETFWREHDRRITWIKPYTKVKNTTFTGKVSIKWYEDGTLNACANCVEIGRASCRERV